MNAGDAFLTPDHDDHLWLVISEPRVDPETLVVVPFWSCLQLRRVFGTRLRSDQLIERETRSTLGAAGVAEAGEVVAAQGAEHRGAQAGDALDPLGGGFTPDENCSQDPRDRHRSAAHQHRDFLGAMTVERLA